LFTISSGVIIANIDFFDIIINKLLERIFMSELHYMPLLNAEYFKSLNNLANIEMQNAIKISLMMVTGFREILDELNFDEEKLRTLQFNLDDNYEAVEEIFKSTKDSKTKETIDELLTQMAKLEMEIGDLILEHRHAS